MYLVDITADLRPTGDGTIVHIRLLPALVDDYRALVERALVRPAWPVLLRTAGAARCASQ